VLSHPYNSLHIEKPLSTSEHFTVQMLCRLFGPLWSLKPAK